MMCCSMGTMSSIVISYHTTASFAALTGFGEWCSYTEWTRTGGVRASKAKPGLSVARPGQRGPIGNTRAAWSEPCRARQDRTRTTTRQDQCQSGRAWAGHDQRPAGSRSEWTMTPPGQPGPGLASHCQVRSKSGQG